MTSWVRTVWTSCSSCLPGWRDQTLEQLLMKVLLEDVLMPVKGQIWLKGNPDPLGS